MDEHSRKDEEISAKDLEIEAKTALLADRERELAGAERIRLDLEEQSGHLSGTLRGVLQLPNYQTLQRLEEKFDRIAPVGTRRRSLVAAAARGVGFLVQHGLFAFALRLVQVWRWAPRLSGDATNAPTAGSESRQRLTLITRASQYRRDHGWVALGWRGLQFLGSAWPVQLEEHQDVSPVLQVVIESHLPPNLEAGHANALVIHGWCRPNAGRLRTLRLILNGSALSVRTRPERHPQRVAVPQEYAGQAQGWTEFWSMAPVPPQFEILDVRLRARLDAGLEVEAQLATIEAVPTGRRVSTSYSKPSSDLEPRVILCMATYNPREDLFSRQVDSIRRQSHTNWLCLVVDDHSEEDCVTMIRRVLGNDARFELHEMPERVGFYRNFERCLSLVPEDGEFVALADHDDYWHEDKLQSLLAGFHTDTTLVYSDMNIVDEDLNHLSETYWTTRRNNYKNLGTLFLANTITGASAMFRRRLLDLLLPFPQEIGQSFHDHWIGVASLSSGHIEYIDRPLYDYVQHPGHVIGHYAPAPAPIAVRVMRFVWRVSAAVLWQRLLLDLCHDIYSYDVQRLRLMAWILSERCANIGWATPEKNRMILKRLTRLDSSLLSLFWLAGRATRSLLGPGQTLGAEGRLLVALFWSHVACRGFSRSSQALS